jgi:hypothetical protein
LLRIATLQKLHFWQHPATHFILFRFHKITGSH